MPPARIICAARGMLGPAQGVDEDARPLATGVGAEQLGDPRHFLRRASAYLRNHLRGIPGEVAFQDLEDATGVLQGRVACRLVVGFGCHLRSRPGVRPGPAIDGVAVDPLAVLRRELRRGGRIGPTLLGAAAGRALVAPVSAHHVIDAGLRVKSAEQPAQGPRCPGSPPGSGSPHWCNARRNP